MHVRSSLSQSLTFMNPDGTWSGEKKWEKKEEVKEETQDEKEEEEKKKAHERTWSMMREVE